MIQPNRNPSILCLFSHIALTRLALAISLLPTISLQVGHGQDRVDLDCVRIERLLPPAGIEIGTADKKRWLQELDAIDKQAASLTIKDVADVAVLSKACRLAIEFRELYQDKDAAKVDRLIKLAHARLEQLKTGSIDWSKDTKRQVRGFSSEVDGSAQPLGLVLPDGWATSKKPLPLYVWLHGRGDKSTDLHFICERLDKDGEVVPDGAIVVHPFGRQCVGYKSAGETDVMEAIDFVCKNYPVDKDRVVLMGFSMGGAGAWHLAAHYTDRFVAVSPGAGFADTSRYQNLKPENFPPQYEQTLWSVYDVPGYTRNLFNIPVFAYSGELDKQMQAALLMEAAFKAEGQVLTHLIGPGMGHKYHPDTLKEILQHMAVAQSAARHSEPDQLWLQTKHLRYSARDWIDIDGMQVPYEDTRVDAKREGDNWTINTKNVSRLRFDLLSMPKGKITIDGDIAGMYIGPPGGHFLCLAHKDGKWHSESPTTWPALRKHPGLCGPIDDAFIDPFLVVLPTSKAAHAGVEQWVRCESAGFIERWRGLFRGQPRVKLDSQVTREDMWRYHLILWGDPQSNSVIRETLAAHKAATFDWSKDNIKIGEHTYDAASHVAALIYPNPLSPNHYIVLNSGPTFRQAHDRTNSLQNPHLPDWNVIALDTPPSASSPGRIAKCGFFDDRWQVDPKLTW
jgi:dienelactone hydrolase